MPNHLVDLWWSDLRVMDHGLVTRLDDREQERARGLAAAADLGRFVVGAVLLRVAVAAATGVPASEVAVDRTCPECGAAHGRPRIPGLHVSVAHAGPLVLVATAPVSVGVDVEAVARGTESVDIADWVRREAEFKAGAAGERSDAEGALSVLDTPAPLPGYLAAVVLAAPRGSVELRIHPAEESAAAIGGL